MKLSKIALILTLAAGSASVSLAGPGPQYWQNLGKPTKPAATAPASGNQGSSNASCDQCCKGAKAGGDAATAKPKN